MNKLKIGYVMFLLLIVYIFLMVVSNHILYGLVVFLLMIILMALMIVTHIEKMKTGGKNE